MGPNNNNNNNTSVEKSLSEMNKGRKNLKRKFDFFHCLESSPRFPEFWGLAVPGFCINH